MANREATLDPDFKKLLDPITPAEKKRLDEQIKEDGQTEDLIGWDEAGILVDGYNRHPILLKYGHTPRIDWRSFGPDTPENRIAVAQKMVRRQLGRRNLTRQRYEWYLGEKYLKELEKAGRKKGEGVVAKRVAEEEGVSPATVRRAAGKVRATKEVEKTDPKRAERIRAGKEKPPKPERKKKAGQAKFDFKRVDNAFGTWHRAGDELLDTYTEAPAAAKTLSRTLNQLNSQARDKWDKIVKLCVEGR